MKKKTFTKYLTFLVILVLFIFVHEAITFSNVPSIEDEALLQPENQQPLEKKVPYDEKYPCTSPESLSTFFKKYSNTPSKQPSKFSNRHPVCPSAAYNTIHVVIPFRNLKAKVIDDAIQSAASQEYPKDRLHIVVYDDSSDIDGSKNILNTVCDIGIGTDNVFDFPITEGEDDNWTRAKYFLQENNITTANMPSLLCFRATKHLGPAGAKFWLFGLTRQLAGPNDIVLLLDGDDEMYHRRALNIVNQKYIDQNAWFTYGSYEGNWNKEVRDLSKDIRSGEKEFDPRRGEWLYGHPRTFKAHLLDEVSHHDFKYRDGSWLVKGTERGFVYRMLELSGPDRIGYISTKIYKYNYSSVTSTLATVSRKVKKNSLRHVKNMTPSEKLKLPIHVVLLSWKRTFLLKYQLQWLNDQQGLNGHRIHLHILNNNLEEKGLEEIVATWKRSVENPIDITVVHALEDEVYNAFGRFAYVEKLRASLPLDFVFFLDDDQYWAPTFLSSLLRDHKPKGMTTWFGKTFKHRPSKRATYYKPVMGNVGLYRGDNWPAISTFKYAGPGGSILDTNLWLLNGQLQRLRGDLRSWSMYDDLWVSYVMDALLGWEIRRVAPPTVPIDIGAYNAKYYRHHNLRLNKEAVHELNVLRKKLGKHSRSIDTVATWSDPTVNKQLIFDTLQRKYLWDIYSSKE